MTSRTVGPLALLLATAVLADPVPRQPDSLAYAVPGSRPTRSRAIKPAGMAILPRVAPEPATTCPGGTDFRVGYSGVASVLLGAILLQTLSASSWMSEGVKNFLLQLADSRAHHPLIANTLCAFCMYAASDVLSQLIGQQRTGARAATIDRTRALRSGFTSSLLSGFLAVFYFGWLERALPAGSDHLPVSFAATAFPILAKIAIDVGLYEPVYDTMYVSIQAALRGETLNDTMAELKKVPTVWCIAPRYWCLVDLVNFSCMPLRLRPLYNAVLSIPWSMYLSTVANDDVKRETEDAAADGHADSCQTSHALATA